MNRQNIAKKEATGFNRYKTTWTCVRDHNGNPTGAWRRVQV